MDANNKYAITNYWPLAVLVIVSILAAFALNTKTSASMASAMHYFMGVFLLFFATLKLFNPKRFADGFAMYDILATKFKPYAYFYILLELMLALAYLSFFIPWLTYVCTIVLMSYGAVGVYNGLKEGLDINCPCMGSVLNVPLSTVSLVEDILMVIMAITLVIHSIISWF